MTEIGTLDPKMILQILREHLDELDEPEQESIISAAEKITGIWTAAMKAPSYADDIMDLVEAEWKKADAEFARQSERFNQMHSKRITCGLKQFNDWQRDNLGGFRQHIAKVKRYHDRKLKIYQDIWENSERQGATTT